MLHSPTCLIFSSLTATQAGGGIGKYITEFLLKTGKHKVTAVTREDSTNTLPAGVLPKKISYDNQDSLVEALKGQDALIITMSVMAPPENQTKLIDAAAAAGVPWVLPNEFGGDPLSVEMGRDTFLGAQKRLFRDQIEALGKSSWVGVACGFWYEYSLGGGEERYGFNIPARTLVLMDDGTTKINTSTMPSVGRAVAALLSLKILPDDSDDKSTSLASFRNKPLYISSFTIGQQDMLDSVQRVSGAGARDWKVTRTTARERFDSGHELLKSGERIGFPRLLYARAFFPGSSLNFEANRGLHNEVLGLPQDDLDEFTKVGLEMSKDVY